MKFIKYTFSLILLMMVSNVVKSQFIYGPQVGVGVSSISGIDAGISSEFGLFIRAEIFDRAGLQPTFIYSLKSGSDNDEANNIDVFYALQYFEIPVLVYFPLSKHISIQVGPNFASGLSGKAKTTSGSTSTTDDVDIDTKMGLAAGFSFETGSRLKIGFLFRSTGAGEGAGLGESASMMVTASYLLDW